MTRSAMKTVQYVLTGISLLFYALPAPAAVEEIRYPSGLISSFGTDSPTDRKLGEREAIDQVLQEQFPSSMEWREIDNIVDKTHVHRLHALYFEGRRVADQFLRTHYNHRGFLQYYTSSLRVLIPNQITVNADPHPNQIRDLWKKKLGGVYRAAYRGDLKLDPVIHIDDKTGVATAAYEVKATWFDKGMIREFYVDARTGKQLAEKKLFRFVDQANAAFKINPDRALPTTGQPESVTLSNLAATSQLKNSYAWVRRDERDHGQSGIAVMQDVDATLDYTSAAVTKAPVFSDNPTLYEGYDCSTFSDQPVAGTLCANTSSDSINVYYHLNAYRQQLATYFTTLGVTSSVNSIFSSLDPLWVIVNSLSVDINADGDPTNDTNNAAYIPTTCRSGQSSTASRCLVFLRPAAVNTTSCSRDGSRVPVTFYDLAREANVIVHEYQHYITDQLTHMVASSTFDPNVGDALHEGYSDYFGASQVTATSGSTITKIGEYAFKNCTPIIRDVAVLREFLNGEEESDPHISGLSWASGLWRLRETLGQSTADLIALKSLLFLSTRPSFVEAVESLVKADAALNAGANVGTIRTLFYDDIKFVGGQSGLFRDPANGILEMGLRSCLSVPSTNYGNAYITLLLFLVWLCFTVAGGRKLGRR